eukprot:CAMPEP_0198280172 /NCGR_PEP_ID=MMETSP1449-20131203/308_1 /TAXON_ID=420275 /ORGANISM="Attheya septentrionalis, Strain CCMP2084" /LENGTH=477 /DNA_ID=CAMNT_0043975455 /DNA_START=99 /DNA_END=1529 /DNA_ORIENTATION=-
MPPRAEGDCNNLPTLQFGVTFEKDDEKDIEVADAAEEERRYKVRKDIHSRYPFLNVQQVDLIGTLDDAIADQIPEIHLPRLRVDDTGQNVTCRSFLAALLVPLLLLITTVSAALSVIFFNNNLFVKTWYPYFVTAFTFLASAPAIKGKYNQYYHTIYGKIDSVKKRVEPQIDMMEKRANNVLRTARFKLNDFLAVTKTKFKEIKRAKKALEQVNTDIEIPDVSDLEKYLDNKEKEINRSIRNAKSSLDLEEYIPWVLKSQRNFNVTIVYPTLFVMLAIQVFVTWQAQQALEPMELFENKWDPVIVSCETFLLAVLQICFSAFVTRKIRILRFVNRRIVSMNQKVNMALRDKASGVFHDIFGVAMLYIKQRVLKIVYHLREIERLATRVKGVTNEMKTSIEQAADQTLWLEDTVQDVANIETHQTSDQMKTISILLSNFAINIDSCTAGFIDCTGFLASPEEERQTRNSGRQSKLEYV